MKYRILTQLSVFDPKRDTDDESYADRLVTEQDSVLSKFGYSTESICLLKRGNRYWIDSIDNTIQSLALKDGVDLVQFSNGNVGFLGYYNGFTDEENHFEIVCKANQEELLNNYGNEFSVIEAERRFKEDRYSYEFTRDLYEDYLVEYLNGKAR